MTKKLPNPITYSKSKYGATIRKRHSSVLRKLQRKRKCPKCGSDKVIPIVYGDIDGSPEVMQQIKNEEIEPGGCCIDEESPKWKCRNCEDRFGELDWV